MKAAGEKFTKNLMKGLPERFEAPDSRFSISFQGTVFLLISAAKRCIVSLSKSFCIINIF